MGYRLSASLLLAAIVALLSVQVTPAVAAPGELTPRGCFQDVGFAPDRCAGQTADALNGAYAVAVSPDATSVYATGINDDAVSIFTRNTTTGALTPAGCIADEGLVGCPTTAEGLSDPYGITVSSDGLSVLVASAGDDAVASLDRNPLTGALTDAGCIGDTSDIAGCGGPTQAGLTDAGGVVVDPAGKYVYGIGKNSTFRLIRDPDTGEITPDGCVAAPGDTPGCGKERPGLTDPSAIAISSDGSSLHVASRQDGAVVSLSAPLLDSRGCVADIDTPVAGCTTTTQGLGSARSVAISPDGKSVYAGGGDGALVRFDRDVASGVLTAVGCISDSGLAIGCAASQQGLSATWGIAVSPDNKNVFTVGEDDAIVQFDRDAGNGVLTAKGCIEEFPIGCTLGSVSGGLNTGRGVIVSPDNTSVYATSFGDSAISRFDREATAIVVPPATAVVVPPGKVAFRTKKLSCKGSCKRAKIKVTVDGPGKVTFCSAPAGVNAPCGLNGKGPSGPTRSLLRSRSRAVKPAMIKTRTIKLSKAGVVRTSLVLTRKTRRVLAKKRKLKLKIQIDFTPTGGERTSKRKKFVIRRKGRS